MNRVMVKNAGGQNPEDMTPAKCVDNNFDTQWLDFARKPLMVTFSGRRNVDAFRFVTGLDAPERDPVEWCLERSCCGASWVALHLQEQPLKMPHGRGNCTDWFHFVPAARFLRAALSDEADVRQEAIAGLVEYVSTTKAFEDSSKREHKVNLAHGIVKRLVAIHEEVRAGACT